MRYDGWNKTDLLYKINELEQENRDLKDKVQQQRFEIEDLKFKIRNELEPRLRRECDSYDRWVTNGER